MRSLWIVVLSLLFVGNAEAQGRRRPCYNCSPQVWQPQLHWQPQQMQTTMPMPQVKESTANVISQNSCEDALDEVNAHRARLGLRAFIKDKLLTKAAFECAKQRSSRMIQGHLPESDFSYLPQGANAAAAGCGAWQPGTGWGTCCTEDNYTYAGAAWVIGPNNLRYMHLFVR